MDLEHTTEVTISGHAQKLGTLAAQLGYEGSLALGSLEDEVRFYQQRTVESCMEIGKRLLLIKEQTPHGEFNKRIEMLNFTPRMAQKFMSAVLKFSKTNSNSLLQKAGNQTKLLELVMLDDDEIELIEQGGSIGDVSLDTIETMSVRELKKALRDAKADIDAKEQVIKTKDQKANELLAENAKLKSPAQIKERAESEQQQFEQAAIAKLNAAKDAFLPAFTKFTNDIGGVIDTADAKDLPQLYENIDELLIYACQRIAGYVQSLGTQVNFEEIVKPSWITDEPTDPVEE
ncbi:DUF3102 domain-containing protein [Acinetobacter sp. CIP 102129]|uniref:DUF3102 domain-containing protein n=1 Tax=Acinetobacter sp. CIP 102129 TaxID=1144664 RepID=UPI0002CFAB60|nr:DUF3102 domain-containing protein [Acinetobacter sp. CIP 102129]ENU87433.1 hypothetical protein F973_00353 [Acinetobacter sp. CIP 102129]